MTAPMKPGATTPATYSPDTTLTLSEIADLTGRDIKTIKNWNDSGQGRWPNAVQDETGRKTWRVPVSDLVATGDLDPSKVEQVENELAARRESKETKALREQVIRLEEQLTAAVALADERAGTIALLKSLVRKGGAA
ncbi:hypothetical protein Q9S36_42385 [Microbacterium sp. ARD31]|uniref:hypothetical protein n=1 Tax=Microbacterium sp. ARD31 TaxID=2962576 RepID=UPI002881E67B|nr:hypothetical protein [Microbacterium sp. ARD31]MDT0186854.1 hypothetical protein [Microbacterium sp. ARD31]